MRKLPIKIVGLAVLTTLVSVIGLPSPSFASSTSGTRTIQVSTDFLAGDRLAIGFLDQGWTLGDCTLDLSNKVTLNLTQGRLVWDGSGRTAKTRNGDIWHSTFTFRDLGGRTVRVGPLDSTKMFPSHDQGYVWSDIQLGVGIPANFVPSTVVWDSAC